MSNIPLMGNLRGAVSSPALSWKVTRLFSVGVPLPFIGAEEVTAQFAVHADLAIVTENQSFLTPWLHPSGS